MNTCAKPEILVVTPTLGKRLTLHRTISGVRKYGGQSVVHVIVGPPALGQYLLRLYPWIYFLEDHAKLGIFHAVNTALNKFTGYEYFSFINDDDYWLPGFTQLIQCIKANPDLSFVYAKTIFASHSYSRFKCGSFSPFYRHFSYLLQMGIPMFTHQSLIIRRHCLQLLGDQFDLSYPLSADSELWARLVQPPFIGKGLNIPASVYSLDPGRLSLDIKLLDRDYSQRMSSNGYITKFAFAAIFRVAIFRLLNIPCYLSRILQIYFLASIHYRRHHLHLFDESTL